MFAARTNRMQRPGAGAAGGRSSGQGGLRLLPASRADPALKPRLMRSNARVLGACGGVF